MRSKEIFLFILFKFGFALSFSCYYCNSCTLNKTNIQSINCLQDQVYCFLGIKDNFFYQACLNDIDNAIKTYKSIKICNVNFCNKNYDSFGKMEKNWSSTTSQSKLFYLFLFFKFLF